MTDIVQPQQQSTPTQPVPTKPRRLLWIIPLPQRKPKQPKTTQIAKAATTTAVTNMVANNEPTFYEQCIEWCHRADKVINLALGYLLAFASVLGFMDVLSNGEVLSHVPQAFYVWLAIMGLGVDFQLFLVIGRFPDLTRQLNGWPRVVFIAFNLAFLAFLCYMSATIGAVFTQHRDVTNSTITGAMAALGINATYFVYERAALATLLLVLMAIDRTMERWRMQVQRDQVGNAQSAQATTVTAQPQISAEDIAAQIRDAVRNEVAGIAQPLIDELRKEMHRFAQTAQPPTAVEEIAQGTAQKAIAQQSTMHNDDTGETPIAQQATQPVMEAVSAAQSEVRKKVFVFLDAYHEEHGKDAAMPTNAVIAVGAPCAKNTASQYRKEYYEQRGGAQ